MDRKGMISLSFGMIFSIIVIIAIVAVAFYAINYFLDLGRCTEISLFYKDLQDDVDAAWNSEITRDTFRGSLPNNVDSVCFRDEDGVGVGVEYDALKDYFRQRGNTFLYPPEKACEQASRTTDHVDLTDLGGWYCFNVDSGRVSIPLDKGSFDALVKVKRA
jgi:hypothetical protein